jgi:hypothetical protein
VKDQNNRHARLRYTATGAVAALVAAGAIAGAVAIAAGPNAKTQGQGAVSTGSITKTPMSPVDKSHAAPPAVDHRPFLNAVQQLVGDGTITAAEGQAVDREIVAGRVDTDTLASSGFTPAQLQALQQALSQTKSAMASQPHRTTK